ncbi:MAG: AbrB/MazE/SpoVT family DNA-binding domain-containing protein [Nitrososphaeria archaeon]|nr:AbrB/MazE/SpoVT family DNA-binding domain-containing protein [Nitrososphaeria archaeon]
MHRLAIILVLAVLTTSVGLTPVNGEAYNAILEDENIRISLYYPPEVKISSCYLFRFEAQAFKTLTIEKIQVKIKLYRDGVTEVLYDRVLIESQAVTSSWTYSKNIEICIPTPRRPDPFLEGKIYAEYSLDGGDEETLSTEWYMSTVREMTYDELASKLSEARREIRDLEKRISSLQSLIENLKNELSSLSKSYSELSSNYGSLKDNYLKLREEYNLIQQKYGNLEKEYTKLNEDYRQLLIDYEKLRTSFDNLMKNNERLQSNYDSLREDYRLLSEEYHKLRGVHQDLSERYNDLKSRYEGSISTIGRLEETIENLEETVKEKQKQIDELNLVYISTSNENTLTKSILYAQTAAVAAVGASLFIMNLRKKKIPPPPPSTIQPTNPSSGEEKIENSKNGKAQKILSGRRITIPKEAVEKLNIKEGGKVVIEICNDYIKVIPVKEEIPERRE